MGSYATRTRAWVYIAFYDEYVGKHILTSAGLSLAFIIPSYWYGVHCNRLKECNLAMKMYDWNYTEKRNRLIHNMIMEHFEVHTEQLQDLLLDLNKEGAKVFQGVPLKDDPLEKVTVDDLAYIDEISGLKDFVDQFLRSTNLPVAVESNFRSYINEYSGTKSKDQVRYEFYRKMYGSR